MKGTVSFMNGWESSDNKVTITISPSGGGIATLHIVDIVGGTWEKELPLTDWSNPSQNYIITPSVGAR